MLILHDPRCAGYGSAMRPEQPARITATAGILRAKHPAWTWRAPQRAVTDDILLRAHSPAHLKRLQEPEDFDDDTPYFPQIEDHARRSVAAALEAAEHALASHGPAFALMRPPGHHATAGQAMGFCYLNQIAIAALFARHSLGASRVAVWDFDAHHGNGTEAIFQAHLSRGETGLFFASVHQSPCYPGTGLADLGPLIRNWPIPPHAPRAGHMAALRESLDAVLAFAPDLILVSAGFDAYARDPITAMTLETADFAMLGRWLRESGRPASAVLEGGYSPDLPLLIDAFLSSWEKDGRAA
ncbi:MAG TPA: histone deacetylase [Opitutaceae bacterium]|nr:histone deacetylase [Opitutaceae bacterium]